MSRTREPQYERCFGRPPVTLGPMTADGWRRDPQRFPMWLNRYKFVSRMLRNKRLVAEIGCGDGFASPIVAQAVNRLDLYDFDPVWRDAALASGNRFRVHDILHDGALPLPTTLAGTDALSGALPAAWRYEAIYALDVLEHIQPADEPQAMRNICNSLKPNGVFIAGCPSLESQAYASEISRAGHVNCRTGDDFVSDMLRYFENVFPFGQNDEVVHTGFFPMCHYLLMLCTGPKTGEG